MNTDILKPTQWGTIFTLLSLDNMAALYEAMGLRLSARDFQKILRRLILENRRIYESNPKTVPRLVDRVLDQVAARFGERLAQHLYMWSTTVFLETHADQPQWSTWEILIGHSTLFQRLKDRDVFTDRRIDAIKDQFDESMDLSETEEVIAESKKHPLSAWDLEMYSLHQYSLDGLSDPFELALRIVEMNQFQIFWGLFIRDVSSSEKDALHQEGQVVAKEMGIWLRGPLEHPDNLRRRI